MLSKRYTKAKPMKNGALTVSKLRLADNSGTEMTIVLMFARHERDDAASFRILI